MTIYVVERVEFCNDFAFTVGPPLAAFASEEEARGFVDRDTGTDPLRIHELEFACPAIERLQAMVARGCEDASPIYEDPLCYFCRSDTFTEGTDGKRHFLHESDCVFANAMSFLDSIEFLKSHQ